MATSGKGHPLPASVEARHNEIPEHAERDKGRGDDPAGLVQPGEEAAEPDGTHYPYADLGRGPGSDRVDRCPGIRTRGERVAEAEDDR